MKKKIFINLKEFLHFKLNKKSQSLYPYPYADTTIHKMHPYADINIHICIRVFTLVDICIRKRKKIIHVWLSIFKIFPSMRDIRILKTYPYPTCYLFKISIQFRFLIHLNRKFHDRIHIKR